MDMGAIIWYYPNMNQPAPIPIFALYGEGGGFPDILHCERIADRAGRHDWQIAPHRHAALHQIFLIRQGAARATVDGGAQDLALPVLLSVPPGVVHGFRFAAGTQGHVLSLPLASLPDVFGQASPLAPILARWGQVPADPGLDALFETVMTERGTQDAARGPMLRALAAQIAAHAARALAGAALPPTRYARHMQAFEALLRQHIARDAHQGWPLAAYAGALGITPTHLNRVVRAQTGQSAARHIEARRCQEACRLLAYTRMRVAEVGYALGFEDPAYFSRAFRRQTGETPSAYRRRLAGVDGVPEGAADGVTA